MNPKTKFFLWVFAALVGLSVLFWLFNTCAYNFWLAGQNIEGREVYARRLYWMLGLFVSALVFEVFVIRRAARTLKAVNAEPPSSSVEGPSKP